MAGGITLGDQWPGINADMGGTAGAVMNGASIVSALTPGAGWVQLGVQLLGGLMSGDSSQSATASGTDGQLNTSGWVVGKGDAQGGGLSSTNMAGWPWYVWAGLGLVGVIAVRRFG